ncbi:transcription factor HES-7.1-A-like [Acipenser oxyrinchus oxyrinchus]|uniref:Transcription factor HES-7.1-A-like n=1 Tax=Acipenser oxyrinchus oxyrinchus TaxID=40147 RepID=A0AAD8CDH3_ACIOX|nr:transcription factor HES-7.1-A-like [Acipenser oxyrinchus oxyrinchus]
MKLTGDTQIEDRKQHKKLLKPLIEKRRRERMNHSLESLRILLLENAQMKKLTNPKVEKAEILESAVEFLRRERACDGAQQRQRLRRVARDASESQRGYHDGFQDCLTRTASFLQQACSQTSETRAETQRCTAPTLAATFSQYMTHHTQSRSSAGRQLYSSAETSPVETAATPEPSARRLQRLVTGWGTSGVSLTPAASSPQKQRRTGATRPRSGERAPLAFRHPNAVSCAPISSKIGHSHSNAVWRPWP